ncbi:MAG: hypothetical protein CLLPBCKN_007274 [Chroococcidiopsis cubana SAG 39.79]|jgi:hypothetical protein|uniref:Uncharacterized protein n=1 Tax=Chroococcidiopsis cubana SAG 39.79 TaxID=388085 RepID=A0AB37URZ8_9CYAN|nr:hypothetical protein [Chroococcidiopsis cubana]MDZ4877839.1 hypothetical protein [Chroococcidiopsis cubana SAG 39.79]RUT14115.1 hypothetical protein DSM107010_05980 [Chroococcidiopsis cubana SAG 39.79]
MLNFFHIAGLSLLSLTSTNSILVDMDSSSNLSNSNFLCYMRTSEGAVLNLENLCQSDEKKENTSIKPGSTSTENNLDNEGELSNEGDSNMDTTSNTPDHSDSLDNESISPDSEQLDIEDNDTEP